MEDGGWFLKPLFLLLFKYTMGPNYKVGFDFLVQCKLDELKKMKKVYEHNKKLISICQLISKAIYGLLTSPKKQTDVFDWFDFLLFAASKSNSSIHFFGRIFGSPIYFSVLSEVRAGLPLVHN